MGTATLPAVGFLPGMVVAYAGPTTQSGWLLCNGALLNRADYPQLFAAISTAYNVGGETGTQFRLPNLLGKVIAMQDVGQTEFATMGLSGGEKTHLLTLTEAPSHDHAFVATANHDHAFAAVGTHAHAFGVDGGHGHGFAAESPATDAPSHGHTVGGTAGVVQRNWGSGWGITGTNVTQSTVASDVDSSSHSHTVNNHGHSFSAVGNHGHAFAADGGHGHSFVSQGGHGHSFVSQGGGTAHNNLQPFLTMNYLIKT